MSTVAQSPAKPGAGAALGTVAPIQRSAKPGGKAEKWSASGALRTGLVAVVVLVGGLGGWSAFTTISGAVVAPGRVKVENNQQVVQHPDGGVVLELDVREGQSVKAGDVLLRLDDRIQRAELAILEGQLYEIMARIGRLEAEQEDAAAPEFDPELLKAASERPEIDALVEGQRRLFTARLDTLNRERDQLRERQVQTRDEIKGAESQMEALKIQLGFIGQELDDQRSLLAKGLTQATRVLSLEREKARLDGEFGSLTAQVAQARGRITEIEIQIVSREATRREEAISELRDLRSKEAELKQQRLSKQETLDRMVIRAPRTGSVIGLTVFTERAVIRPAEPILYIVPQEAPLVVEARIEPQKIDQVYVGQPARLHFSAFDQRTTPQIDAVLARISPDAITDEKTGMSYYSVEVDITAEGRKQLGDLKLLAGMPVEAFMQTGDRTPLSYLLHPVANYFRAALKER